MLLALALAGWIGLKVTPDPLPAYPANTTLDRTFPLPEDLPAPVARFYRTIAGESIPVIDSAVMTGPARLRFGGITFPSRYRFIHEAGRNYRHYIELTFLGQVITKVNEFYLDGSSRLELPFGTVDNEPKVNQAANLGLWGESMVLPSIFLTDPRVRWEAIDDATARLVVPFEVGKTRLPSISTQTPGRLHRRRSGLQRGRVRSHPPSRAVKTALPSMRSRRAKRR